jgi:arginase
MSSRYAVYSAPSILGLWPSGVQKLGETLLEHGFAERIGTSLAGTLVPPPYSRDRDPVTGFINGLAARQYALDLERLIAGDFDAKRIPIILGGDCSILHGALIALKRLGRHGLFYMDGHADYYRSTDYLTGEIADMGLAIATGANHPLLADIDGLAPYIIPEDAAAFGFRDEELMLADGSQPIRGSGIALFDLPRIRRIGFDAAIAEAVRQLSDPGIHGIFVHFDTDALSDAVNPAVDYRIPDGLSFDEAEAAIRAIRNTGKMMGLTVSIFNPRLDPDGRIALGITECLVKALRY